jgi:putative sterol carrier protein
MLDQLWDEHREGFADYFLGGFEIVKKILTVLFSAALLLVALVVLSGCSKAAPQATAPVTPAPQAIVPATIVPTTIAPTTIAPTTIAPVATTTATKAPGTTTTVTTKTTTKTVTPAPVARNDFDTYLARLQTKFLPAAAAGVTCTYQFNITSGDTGLYWLKIANGKCTVGDGAVANPTLTINVGEQLWADMASGKVDGTAAFLTGKYTAAPMSNIKYLQNMKSYFN